MKFAGGEVLAPPLLHVGATAPYFHDGRYPTLERLLADNFDRMGQTSHLPPGDDAVERSLFPDRRAVEPEGAEPSGRQLQRERLGSREERHAGGARGAR